MEILSSPVPGLDIRLVNKLMASNIYSVADPNPDPDPPDPHVFGPSGSFYHHAKIVTKTLIPTIL